jgi:hypothetical protein
MASVLGGALRFSRFRDLGFFSYLRIKSFYKIINIELNKLGVLKKKGIKWILNLTT